jgi:hypothetical protein
MRQIRLLHVTSESLLASARSASQGRSYAGCRSIKLGLDKASNINRPRTPPDDLFARAVGAHDIDVFAELAGSQRDLGRRTSILR